MKFLIPACTIRPTHERSSAERSRNHGISLCMRVMALVLKEPTARCSAMAARSREGGRTSADTVGRLQAPTLLSEPLIVWLTVCPFHPPSVAAVTRNGREEERA